MGVFDADDAPCGVFGAVDGMGTTITLPFVRGVSFQNSAAETLVSFSTIGTFTIDLQPLPAGIQRLVHGIVRDVAYRAFAPGNPDIRELDRTMISGVQVEVAQAAHYGTEHVELDFVHIGR